MNHCNNIIKNLSKDKRHLQTFGLLRTRRCSGDPAIPDPSCSGPPHVAFGVVGMSELGHCWSWLHHRQLLGLGENHHDVPVAVLTEHRNWCPRGSVVPGCIGPMSLDFEVVSAHEVGVALFVCYVLVPPVEQVSEVSLVDVYASESVVIHGQIYNICWEVWHWFRHIRRGWLRRVESNSVATVMTIQYT